MAALVPKPDSPYGEPEKYSTDQLEAAGVERAITYDRPAHYVDIDPVAEAKLRRKLDIRLLPLCTLLYLLNYIDRVSHREISSTPGSRLTRLSVMSRQQSVMRELPDSTSISA